MVDRDGTLRKLVDMQYSRNDQVLGRGTFRVRGETLEVFPAYAESAYRAVFFGDEVEPLQHFDPLTGEVYDELEHIGVWPATHYATDRPTIERAVGEIRDELEARCKELEARGQAARVAPPAPAHPVRHGDAARARLLQRDRELLADPRRARSRASGPTACSTTSPTTSSASSTSRTRRCRRSAACTRATARASRRSWSTASGCRARSTTGPRPSTSSSRSCRRSCSSRPRPATSSATTPSRIVEQIVRPDGHRRPGGRGARDQEPDRRPDERDPRRAPRPASARSSRR